MDLFISFWNVLAMMAPWLLIGFFLAGVASVLLPREWVVRAMGRAKGWRGVLNAVLIGVPFPICSCGVLPLTTGLRKAGAGKGAVSGFLISTPQTGLDSILATYALMGPAFAIARPLAAFATGLLGGAAVDILTRRESERPPPRRRTSNAVPIAIVIIMSTSLRLRVETSSSGFSARDMANCSAKSPALSPSAS